MKYGKWLGLFVSVVLIWICFSPWTFHADLNKTFTGFFSEKDVYGKPGRYLVFFAIVSALLLMTEKLWAKRIHIFLSGLMLAYAIKTYILYTSCYNAYCPEKKYGIYIMLACCVLMLVVSIFPDIKLDSSEEAYK